MNTKTLALAALIVVAAFVWWLLREGPDGATDPDSSATSSASQESASHGSGSDPASMATGRRDGGTDAGIAAAPSGNEAVTPTEPVDPARAAADAYRRRIQEALQDRIASTSREENRDFDGRLDPQYIREAVREIRPLLEECYDMTIEAAESAGEEVPEGQLIAEFTIVGAEGEGGIVETSSIDENSELFHPLLDECARETLYALELPAPEEGGRIMVRYPFRFRVAEEEEPAP